MRRYSRRDDDASESPVDVDDAGSSSSSTRRSVSRSSSAATSTSADPVHDGGQSSPLSSDVIPRPHQRSRSAVGRSYSHVEGPSGARNRPPTERHAEMSPSDDLLDVLDGGQGIYDCVTSAISYFEGRVGSLRRRRRSAVTPELMQMERERASPTVTSFVTSPSHQRTATPDPPPRTTRRRLLPQPGHAGAFDDVANLRHPVSSRYFMPISDQPHEGRTSASRRLPLVVDTGVSATQSSSAAQSRDRCLLSADEVATVVTSADDNKTNSSACPSRVENRRDETASLSGWTRTTVPPSRQHHQRHPTSTTSESVLVGENDDDDDRLLDLPDDDHGGQLSARLTFRSSTLPGRWKLHLSNGESPKSVDKRDFRELWKAPVGGSEEDGTQQDNELGKSASHTASTQSTSSMARVEAMKDRFRRLSEMYKSSLEEDDALTTSTKTKKPQNSDVDSKQPAGGTDSTEVGSIAKTSTLVTSDTESQSSCGRDEGFESETTTNSVICGADTSSPELIHEEETSRAEMDTTAPICNETISIDSVVPEPCSNSFNEHNSVGEVTAVDVSPSSRGEPSSDETVRCGGTTDYEVVATPTSTSHRSSRLSQQRAFFDRLSVTRRSRTRSPQPAASEATSRIGLYSSPMVRRKKNTPAANGAPPPSQRNYAPSTPGTERRRRSDAGQVEETSTSSTFVRNSFTRRSLPHSGVSVRAAAGGRPTASNDQKQSVALTPSSLLRRSYRPPSKTRDGDAVRTATGYCTGPVAHNGIQTKPSNVSRVFSTPVRFGPTSHQTRPTRETAAVERQNTADGGGPPKHTDHAVSPDGHSHSSSHQTSENGPEITQDNRSTSKLSERKSVFERLFEKSRRHSKSGTNANGMPAPASLTGATQCPTAESHNKLSSKRPNTANSARQSVNGDR